MMKDKNISTKRKSGWPCSETRSGQLVAADVSRRSRGSRAKRVRRDPLWTTDQAGIVMQNPPTHVGGYGARVAMNWGGPNRESSISKSLICKTALRKSLISMIVSDIFTHIGSFLMPSDNLTLSFHDGLG